MTIAGFDRMIAATTLEIRTALRSNDIDLAWLLASRNAGYRILRSMLEPK